MSIERFIKQYEKKLNTVQISMLRFNMTNFCSFRLHNIERVVPELNTQKIEHKAVFLFEDDGAEVQMTIKF
jgi:hypothetical protein